MNNGPRVVRITLEMDLVEGEHFNTIGAEETPPWWGTDVQITRWAKNYFLDEVLRDYVLGRNPDLLLEEYIQAEITEQPT